MTESDFAVLVERLDNLKEQVNDAASIARSAAEKSETFRAKIMTKLDTLPCEARIEGTKSIRADIGGLQRLVSKVLWYGVPALLALAVAWGALRNDVERIKDTSYGYRGIKVVMDGRS